MKHVLGLRLLWQGLTILIWGIVGPTTLAQTTPSCSSVTIEPFVDVHVGGDTARTGIQNYFPPDGCKIADFRVGKSAGKGYGDTEFRIDSVKPEQATVWWRAKSHWQIIDTKTAHLVLKADIQLAPISPSSNPTQTPVPANATPVPGDKGKVANTSDVLPSLPSIIALVSIAAMTLIMGLRALKYMHGGGGQNTIYLAILTSLILAYIIGLLFEGSAFIKVMGMELTTRGASATMAGVIGLILIVYIKRKPNNQIPAKHNK